VFLARALAQDADLYLLDEPFAGVDAATERAIVDVLKEPEGRGQDGDRRASRPGHGGGVFRPGLPDQRPSVAEGPWRRPSRPRRCRGLWRAPCGDPCRQLALAGSRVDPFSTRCCFRRATTPPSSPSAPALLGFAAGASGTFLFLRKRALVSDAIAHATLPGVGLPSSSWWRWAATGATCWGLLIGSAITARSGCCSIQWIVARTRLTEDAAIGAVLGVFFGFGHRAADGDPVDVAGRQAGLEGFLLGSTAGMLRQDAIVILAGGALALALVWVMRRPMTLVAFDPDFATAAGIQPVAST
jgi:hypothetical protein